MGSQRFINPNNFSIKDEEGQVLNDDAYVWLVKKYAEQHGINITKKSLRDGILAEIQRHEHSAIIANPLFQDANKLIKGQLK